MMLDIILLLEEERVVGEEFYGGRLLAGVTEQELRWRVTSVLGLNDYVMEVRWSQVFYGKYRAWKNTAGNLSVMEMA